jgi:hypothetical protein
MPVRAVEYMSKHMFHILHMEKRAIKKACQPLRVNVAMPARDQESEFRHHATYIECVGYRCTCTGMPTDKHVWADKNVDASPGGCAPLRESMYLPLLTIPVELILVHHFVRKCIQA